MSWRYVPLSSVAEIVMGNAPSSAVLNTENDGVPFLQGSGTFGFKFPTFNSWCSVPNKLARKGDILMSVRAPVGDTNIADREYCIGRGLCAIRASKVDQAYLRYAVSYAVDSLARVSQGSTINAVNKSNIEQMLIPLPPLPVQRWIADALASVDELLDSTRDLSKSLKSSINSIIETFINTEKNLYIRLDSILEFKNGINYRQEVGGKIVKIIGVGDFGNSRSLSDDYQPTEISIDRNIPSSYLVQFGDFLFVRSNGNKSLVGRAIIVNKIIENTFFSGFTIRGRIKDGVNVDSDYLSWMLNHSSFRSKLISSGDSGQLSNLNQSALGEALIPLPTIERQRSISVALLAFENQTSVLRKEMEIIELIKKTLLQQLLTGSLQPVGGWQAVLRKSTQATAP